MLKSADLFKILSVDKRIDIIEHLKRGEKSVNTLAAELDITASAVSQHLRVLKSAGLVVGDRCGQRVEYSLSRDALEECRQRLNRICTCGCLDGKLGSGGKAGKK